MGNRHSKRSKGKVSNNAQPKSPTSNPKSDNARISSNKTNNIGFSKSPTSNPKSDNVRISSKKTNNTDFSKFESQKECEKKEPQPFKQAGLNYGIQVWRIENQKVKHWPKERYGTFYSTECFLILNSARCEEYVKQYSLFIWVGDKTNYEQQQIGIAKLIELFQILNTKNCIQYREVQGNESKSFVDLWRLMVTKICSINDEFHGIHHVYPNKYEPQLLHISGYKKHVHVYQVPITAQSLNNSDSFILDLGLTIFQWNGDKSCAWNKRKANAIVDELQAKRHGEVRDTYIIDGINDSGLQQIETFWTYLGGRPKSIKLTDPEINIEHVVICTKLLLLNRLMSNSQFTQVCVNQIDYSKLVSDDIFVLNCVNGEYIYVWVGRGCVDVNVENTINGINIGLEYLKQMDKTNLLVAGWIRETLKNIPQDIIEICFQYFFMKGRETNVPICSVIEGYETKEFWVGLNGEVVGGRNLMKQKWRKGR